MFLDSSRYAKIPTVEATDREGRAVTALKLRRLPPTPGSPAELKENDRLDLLAHAKLADGTRFWQVADANTALDARTLANESPAEKDRRERDQLPPVINLPFIS